MPVQSWGSYIHHCPSPKLRKLDPRGLTAEPLQMTGILNAKGCDVSERRDQLQKFRVEARAGRARVGDCVCLEWGKGRSPGVTGVSTRHA